MVKEKKTLRWIQAAMETVHCHTHFLTQTGPKLLSTQPLLPCPIHHPNVILASQTIMVFFN